MQNLQEVSYTKQEALLFDNCKKPIKSEAAVYNVRKQSQPSEECAHQQNKPDKRKKGKIINNFISKDQNQNYNKKKAISKLKSIITNHDVYFKQTHTKVQLLKNIFTLIDRNLKLVNLESQKGDFKKYYPVKMPKKYQFLSKEQEIRFRQRNIVAESFCLLNHGHKPLLNLMQSKGVKVQISESRYKSSAQAVAIDGYRQLQKFIFGQCKIKIIAIPRNQIKKIRGVILNCRMTLTEEEWVTFLNFIRILYGLSDACIVKSIAIKLYVSILTILKERLKQFPIQQKEVGQRKGLSKDYFQQHSSQKLRQIWNIQYEKQLLQIYKEYQSFQSIKEHFQDLFPENKQYFTRLALQARLHHIIRATLKKLRNIVDQKYKDRLRLRRLDDKVVKKILAAAQAKQIRIKLIDFYYLQEVPFEELVYIINTINAFIINYDCKVKQKIKQGNRADKDCSQISSYQDIQLNQYLQEDCVVSQCKVFNSK